MTKGNTVPFPCVDDRPLVTKPFCGLLIPPDIFEQLPSQQTGKKKPKSTKHRISTWDCWLCTKRNDEAERYCVHCMRPKIPEWLKLVDGEYVGIGNFVRIKVNKRNLLGLVTQIDYRDKKIEVVCADEQNLLKNKQAGNILIEPERHLLESIELTKGNLAIIWGDKVKPEESKETALMLCNFLLCGKCASVSILCNGVSVLDDEKIKADKQGKLRGIESDIAELTNKVRYQNRKWRESKDGYELLKELTEQLETTKAVAAGLRKQLADLQFWCTACGWEWPQDHPHQIM